MAYVNERESPIHDHIEEMGERLCNRLETRLDNLGTRICNKLDKQTNYLSVMIALGFLALGIFHFFH